MARTTEELVRLERERQGLPTPARPTGDPAYDAELAAAYHHTAAVLASTTRRAERPVPVGSNVLGETG